MLRVLVHEFAILHPEDGPRRALRAFAKASHNRRECGQGFAPACEPPHATATVALLRPPTRFEAQHGLRWLSPDFANFSSLFFFVSSVFFFFLFFIETRRSKLDDAICLLVHRTRESRVNSTLRTIDLPCRGRGAILSPVERRWNVATVGRDVSYFVNGGSTIEGHATRIERHEKRRKETEAIGNTSFPRRGGSRLT